MPSDKKSGFTLVEIIVAIALLGLVFFSLASVFRTSLVLIADGRAKITANAILVEQIERARALDYETVGTYVISPSCPIYNENNVNCVVGVPAGVIPQTKTERLNNLDYTITAQILYIDGEGDGVGSADSNGIITDFKELVVIISWNDRGDARQIRGSTLIAPPGIETSPGGGTLRVNVVTSLGLPVSGANVLISNTTSSPAISQSANTNSDGERFVSALEATSGYNVTVTKAGFGTAGTYIIEPSDLNGDGFVNVNPIQAPVTVEENLVTTLTLVVDPLASLEITSFLEDEKLLISNNFTNADDLFLINTNISGGVGALSLTSDLVTYESTGTIRTSPLVVDNENLGWLWLEFDSNQPAGSSILARLYFINEVGDRLLIPDTDLLSNSSGFNGSVPIDLTGLDVSLYSEIVLEFSLSGNTISTPELSEFRLYALQSGEVVTGTSVEIQSNKIIGTDGSGNTRAKNIYEFIVTNVLGIQIYDDIESGGYALDSITAPTGYNLRSACVAPGSQFSLEATGDNFITTIWRDSLSTNNSLLVAVVNGSGNPMPGLEVEIDNDVVARRGITDPCGRYLFSDIPAGTTALTFSGPTILTRTVTINVGEVTDHQETF